MVAPLGSSGQNKHFIVSGLSVFTALDIAWNFYLKTSNLMLKELSMSLMKKEKKTGEGMKAKGAGGWLWNISKVKKTSCIIPRPSYPTLK